ncbi:histone-lysine N-methyltransferase SETMAR [Trichonephila clavipes]|nr:histone-lysine N-methyltransferase SETMAR [Trichonephila clavipes]
MLSLTTLTRSGALNERGKPFLVRVLFLYERKSDHNTAVDARNTNAAFGDNLVNELTIRRWYVKFESGDESLTNEDEGRPEVVLDNEVLRAIVEQNPGYTVRDYADELGVTSTAVSRHLKTNGKVKKWINRFFLNYK